MDICQKLEYYNKILEEYKAQPGYNPTSKQVQKVANKIRKLNSKQFKYEIMSADELNVEIEQKNKKIDKLVANLGPVLIICGALGLMTFSLLIPKFMTGLLLCGCVLSAIGVISSAVNLGKIIKNSIELKNIILPVKDKKEKKELQQKQNDNIIISFGNSDINNTKTKNLRSQQNLNNNDDFTI